LRHGRATGTALITEGSIQLKHAQFANDYRPIDPDCSCAVCKKYTRAYLHTVAAKEEVGGQLLSYHNIAYQMRYDAHAPSARRRRLWLAARARIAEGRHLAL
jgi:queuine tRNA-ribosyltransferase